MTSGGIVYELILMPEHGAWHEHTIGIFDSKASAEDWITKNYPHMDEVERGYHFTALPYILNHGTRVPWWEPAT